MFLTKVNDILTHGIEQYLADSDFLNVEETVLLICQ